MILAAALLTFQLYIIEYLSFDITKVLIEVTLG